MELPKHGNVSAIAVVVDINHFTKIVRDASEAVEGAIVAQFVRDVLSGGISAIQDQGGEVVGFMGDAILGLLSDAQSFFLAAVTIARAVDRHCEWVSRHQQEDSFAWSFAHGGASLKITAEYGSLNVSTIHSRLLGEQRLFIGDAVNYAARIGAAGEGNRCLLGPQAAQLVTAAGYGLLGPYKVGGKCHEGEFEYYQLELGDIWREGGLEEGADTYWG